MKNVAHASENPEIEILTFAAPCQKESSKRDQTPSSEYTTVPPQYSVLFPFLLQNKPGIMGVGILQVIIRLPLSDEQQVQLFTNHQITLQILALYLNHSDIFREKIFLCFAPPQWISFSLFQFHKKVLRKNRIIKVSN